MKTTNKLRFELFYSDFFCAEFKSLDKAIKQAVETYKNNEDMFDRPDFYYIKLGINVIATIKAIDGKIIIE